MTTKQDANTFEKLVLIFIIAVTVVQFSVWGYDLSIYILGSLFNVRVPDASIFTSLVGLLAIIGSVLIIVGSGFWFMEQFKKASSYINAGVAFFVGKNIVDVVDSLVVFNQTTPRPVLSDIQNLASEVGGDLFQLIFWVLIGIYLYYRVQKNTSAAHNN